MKHIRHTILISTFAGLIFYSYLFFGETGELPFFAIQIKYLIATILISNLISFGIVAISNYLNKRISWKDYFWRRFLSGLILTISYSLIISIIVVVIYYFLCIQNLTFTGFLIEHFDILTRLEILLILISFIYTILNFSFFSYRQYTITQIEALRLSNDQINLQFQMLKSQLSPHYLFNSLNTISSLAYRYTDTAEQYIRKFAETYQFILSTNDRKLVEIREELEFLKAYIFMLEIRYEKALAIKIDIESRILEYEIPPLSIQMLVENAIKHNTISEIKPLKIIIYNEGSDFIVVKNNFIGKSHFIKFENKLIDKPAKKDSYKIGLNNIRSRYKYFTKTPVSITKNKDFTVKIPLLSPEI